MEHWENISPSERVRDLPAHPALHTKARDVPTHLEGLEAG